MSGARGSRKDVRAEIAKALNGNPDGILAADIAAQIGEDCHKVATILAHMKRRGEATSVLRGVSQGVLWLPCDAPASDSLRAVEADPEARWRKLAAAGVRLS